MKSLTTLLAAGTTLLAANLMGLVAGDIAIIGFNFDDPDQMAFVTLVDVTSGTQIKFTDNGWMSSGSFRANEGTFTYTFSANTSAGTIISPAVSGVSFSGSGDQILAYQGSDSTPTFLYALNSEGSSVWQSDATSANTSALPTGLTNGTTAVALAEIDNAIFNTSTLSSGTKSEWLAAIGNTSNWSGSDTTRQTMPSGTISVVPEPSTYAAMAGVLMLGLAALRRRHA